MNCSCDKTTCTNCGGIDFVVTSVNDDIELLEQVSQSEFLVLTKLAHANLDHYASLVDRALAGLVSSSIDGWKAEFGTYRLLRLKSLRAELGTLKYILVFGLGDYRNFEGRRLCAFTGFTLSTAARCDAKSITFVESPHRSTSSSVSLAGTSAIMRCRAELLKSMGHLRQLDTVTYLAAPQAKRHLLTGLSADVPRCRQCANPQV